MPTVGKSKVLRCVPRTWLWLWGGHHLKCVTVAMSHLPPHLCVLIYLKKELGEVGPRSFGLYSCMEDLLSNRSI